MKNPDLRGNDLVFAPQGEADRFDHYEGPMGGDVRMSIKGHGVENRDELGGQQVQKVGRGYHGPRSARGKRGDEDDY